MRFLGGGVGHMTSTIDHPAPTIPDPTPENDQEADEQATSGSDDDDQLFGPSIQPSESILPVGLGQLAETEDEPDDGPQGDTDADEDEDEDGNVSEIDDEEWNDGDEEGETYDPEEGLQQSDETREGYAPL